MSTVRMADLAHGTRVRHLDWLETGTIRVVRFGRASERDVTEICWDDASGDCEVSPDGPVFPSDVEIIGRAP
jgi:hypothetical protein